jgi:homogentisate 1,2-dioxygenase
MVESFGPIEPPKRYLNKFGQFLEHAPFCERDIRFPEFIGPVDETGEFEVKVKLRNGIQDITIANHPYDLVGWDGYYYPWIFNIKDFMPIVGKVHQPPPVHQTFAGPGFVICSFVPRLFDFHEKSIPAPYNHSNVDSDEILYYVEGDFMSRKGVSEGSITLHPAGFPHGPQPGKYEGSIGKKETFEYAVMLDTFKPLMVAKDSEEIDDPKYPYSWME